MKIGSRELLEAYHGSHLEVIRAWLRGELNRCEQRDLDDIFATAPLKPKDMIVAARAAVSDPVQKISYEDLPPVTGRDAPNLEIYLSSKDIENMLRGN